MGDIAWEDYQPKNPILVADLYDFEFYGSSNGIETRRHDLLGLHLHEVPTSKDLTFDGFLCIGNVKCYVEGMSLLQLSIEGYGNGESPAVETYVQSKLAYKDTDYDIWLRLQTPTKGYTKLHGDFLWVARLTKHVVDYMEGRPTQSVGLETFRTNFHSWLVLQYPRSAAFRKWHIEFLCRADFRTAINAHIEFLYRQASRIPDAKHVLDQPLWAECKARRGLTAIEKQAQDVKFTLATLEVYESFKDMYFGSMIKSMSPSPSVKAKQERRKSQLHFPTCPTLPVSGVPPWKDPPCHPYSKSKIQAGDIVCL
jgi:DNA (cytosine-5)-methyltransferase 1